MVYIFYDRRKLQKTKEPT